MGKVNEESWLVGKILCPQRQGMTKGGTPPLLTGTKGEVRGGIPEDSWS